MSNGIKRSLHYFTRNAEIYMAVLLGIGVAMTLLTAFNISEELSDFISIMEMFPVMLTAMAAMIILVTSMMSAQYTYSFVLSFGSTRKASFLGMQWMMLLLVIQVTLIDGIVMKFLEKKSGIGTDILFYYFTGLVAICGLSQLLEVVVMKLGRIGTIIIIILYCGIGMMLGLAMVSTEKSVSLLEYIVEMNLPKIVLLLGAVLLYVIGATAAYWNIRKFEVKI